MAKGIFPVGTHRVCPPYNVIAGLTRNLLFGWGTSLYV